jgi:hypothetical protein
MGRLNQKLDIIMDQIQRQVNMNIFFQHFLQLELEKAKDLQEILN